MKRMVAATALVGVLLIGGISAYFTDTDSTTNNFTVGKIDIELHEDNWVEPQTPIVTVEAGGAS